jgi:hypothetical protein
MTLFGVLVDLIAWSVRLANANNAKSGSTTLYHLCKTPVPFCSRSGTPHSPSLSSNTGMTSLTNINVNGGSMTSKVEHSHLCSKCTPMRLLSGSSKTLCDNRDKQVQQPKIEHNNANDEE